MAREPGFTLPEDIGETNLAADMPEKVKELHTRLVAWRKEVYAPIPTKNDETATADPPKKKGNGKDAE